jgi:hypothetical protein
MKTVYAVWRPASVKLPTDDGHEWILHRCLVFVTSDGLEVYPAPGEPVFTSPVDFTATSEPRSKRLHVGVDITTERGLAVVTPTGGCLSCGSRLRGWYPSWAQNVGAWPRPEEAVS